MENRINSQVDKPPSGAVQTIIIRIWREDGAFEEPQWRYLCAQVHGAQSTVLYADRVRMLAALEQLLSSMTGEKKP